MELTSELLNRKVGFYLWLPSLFNCLIKTLTNHSNNFDLGINQSIKIVTLITKVIFLQRYSFFIFTINSQITFETENRVNLFFLFLLNHLLLLNKRINRPIKIIKANPSKNIIICSGSLNRFKSLVF